MELNTYKREKYQVIIDIICRYKGIDKEQLSIILKDKDCKYLLFLLLEKYKCADMDNIKKDLNMINIKSIKYNLKKAEEKFFVNRDFRERYFELEKIAQKII